MHMRNSGLHTKARTLALLVLCAALTAGAASCSLFGKKDKKPMQRPRPVRPQAFDFKFALQPGATYSGTFFLDESAQITTADESGMFAAMAPLRFDLAMTWKVLEQDKDKTDQFTIEMLIDEITLASDSLDAEAAAQVLPRLQGQKMTLVVNDKGEIEDFHALDLDALFSQLEEEYKRKAAPLAVVAMAKKQLTWDMMVERFGMAFRFTPQPDEDAAAADSKRKKAGIVLKKKDDTWNAKPIVVTLPGQMSVPVELKYKFADLKTDQGASMAHVLFGAKQDLSQYAMSDEVLDGFMARGKRVSQKTGAYQTLEAQGYVVYNTTARDVEEIKADLKATGKITLTPRRGDPVEGQLELKRTFLLSMAQKQEAQEASGTGK
jgi:hypothetical protein